MNDKFFDLKKEKQDRMINAALKVFALNGYEHASTDEIVKEAGVSKGLLFHYFTNKIGLYTFIYDYSVKYMMLELSTAVAKTETEYFELLSQMKAAEIQVMYNYPYMSYFLNESRKENVREALEVTEDKRDVLPHQYKQIMRRADFGRFDKEVSVEKLSRMLIWTMNGILAEQFQNGTFQPDQYGAEVKQYLDMAKKMSYGV